MPQFIDEEAFLVELGKLYAKTRTQGSVWLWCKQHFENVQHKKRKPVDPEALAMAPPSCIIRASDGSRTISCIVPSERVGPFSASVNNVMRYNFDGLKRAAGGKGAKKVNEKKKKRKRGSGGRKARERGKAKDGKKEGQGEDNNGKGGGEGEREGEGAGEGEANQ
ncbi:unnamed protein product [Vitrella brassicaformis CCMP3155]|uniref:Signal recognition particle 14 kDa protein n=2 Tax=Vitrella brassicaformis TaxID=1169539 RepID=A0A0G4FSV4_VITBC|nr:unnamed protein product [Vitrella brassicaformis CCMP3155]|eukprot:CEM17536.1 unnamed protein product [Vitrella brassicaformis CCMP3155]